MKQDNPEDCIGYFFTQQQTDPVRGLMKVVVHFKSIRYLAETRSVQVAYNQLTIDADALEFFKRQGGKLPSSNKDVLRTVIKSNQYKQQIASLTRENQELVAKISQLD